MKTNLKLSLLAFALIAFFIFYNLPVSAEEDVQELKKQIEQLQKRVEELEFSQTRKEEDPRGFFNRGAGRQLDPFSEMERMQKEMNRMFGNSFYQRSWPSDQMFGPNVMNSYDFDLQETKDGYEIKVDMTGLDKKKIDIEVNEHSITIKGEHSKEDIKESPNQYFQSKSFGSFMKTIPLPIDADTENIQTEQKGDSLVIKLPKKIS